MAKFFKRGAVNHPTLISLIGLAGLVALTVGMIGFTGCDTFFGNMEGSLTTNIPPVVEFTNVPAAGDTFAYAPVIHWKGSDADGFVEYYSYADIIDSTALADPVYYINFIPDEAWVETEATSDTVYLLTETGRITEHVFYLKCTDDRDEESFVIYRPFYRSNEPPNVPEIKWATDPDSAFGNDIIVEDTLYVLDNITETWPGLGFVWKSSDPDDRDLYKIPLEFRYFLEKTPHDTVWQWIAPGWSNKQDFQFAGLETGHYILTVWARDDGFELSERPASATFDVYKPTFEQSVLLINSTYESVEDDREGLGNVLPGDQIGELYQNLVSRYPDVEYFHFPNEEGIEPFKSYLGRFRLVIWFSENLRGTSAPYEPFLRSYVRVGGRLWVLGAFARRNIITNVTMGLAGSSLSGSGVSVPTNEAEFVGATSGVSDLPDLYIDTSKTAEAYKVFFDGGYRTYPLLPGIDIMTVGSGAETAYYFKSYTDTASGDVYNDTATVVVNVDTIYYPPSPVDCFIRIERPRVLEVTRVENITRGVIGEVLTLTNIGDFAVVRVSYPYGEPWAVTDKVVVDYRFQPYSDFHLRPCALRFERISQSEDGRSFEIRYRVAIFAFPLYFLDNSNGDVHRMVNSMLDWFFLPYAH